MTLARIAGPVSLLLLLVACGGGTPTADSGAAPDTNDDSTAPQTTAEKSVQQLPGDWVSSCIVLANNDSRIVTLSFSEDRYEAQTAYYSNYSCKGSPRLVANDAGLYTVSGSNLDLEPTTVGGGMYGDYRYEMFAVENDRLYLGDVKTGSGSADFERPSQLERDYSFRRIEPDTRGS